MDEILIPISPGELIDKLTILRIKSEKLTDPSKLENVRFEQRRLQLIADDVLPTDETLSTLWAELYEVNVDLWTIEEDIRKFEDQKDFGAAFIALARAVYVTNDRRAELKKQINTLLGSTLVEEKSYTSCLP
ncbi:hypothetical protein SAMN05444003_2049 [Cognatiyoonia sediminum]|uniref:Uncharacterized protein n=1 Tax=Cognatiyoonia sediminum TaxID=1508389 RepID=A0A1M5Q4D1_9RHOB|nr:DUF6165 family protein [Cognatiyoonia sediminum]SHH09127.1 hypothetical protein SAMN05444003_2049 [Cognatiyoonia sediminum]